MNRDLAVQVPTYRDANGYYAELGLPPTATIPEIKKVTRRWMRQFHPDGPHPNREAFERVEMIHHILTDPVAKAEYDHTPDGEHFIDRMVAEELARVLSPERIAELFEDRKFYSYQASVPVDGDRELAEQWYFHLVPAGAALGLKDRLRVCVSSFYAVHGEEVYVPREPPTRERADELMRTMRDVRPG